MKVTHYYAGCMVDDEPVRTENRIHPDDPGLTHLKYIELFCKLLMSEGLLGDFFYRYAEYDNKETIDQYFWNTEPDRWLISGISWKGRVDDYFFLSIKWEQLVKGVS